MLSHAAHLPFPPAHRAFALSYIRRQFRKARNLQGRPNIHAAMVAAYADEERLRQAAAHRDPAALSAVAAQLVALQAEHAKQTANSRAPSQRRRPPPNPNPVPPTRKKKLRRLARTRKQNILLSLRHRRKPPILIDANGFPLLRYRGARQPLRLSMMLATKVERQQASIELLGYLQSDGLLYARTEDLWDQMLEGIFPVFEAGEPRNGYERTTLAAAAELIKAHRERSARQVEIVKGMEKTIKDWQEKREAYRLVYRRNKRRRARRRQAERQYGPKPAVKESQSTKLGESQETVESGPGRGMVVGSDGQ